MMHAPGDRRQRQGQKQLGQEIVVEKVIAKICKKSSTKDLLMLPPEPFQRYKNDHEQRQPDTQSDGIERQWRQMLLQLLERFHGSATVTRPDETRLTAFCQVPADGKHPRETNAY